MNNQVSRANFKKLMISLIDFKLIDGNSILAGARERDDFYLSLIIIIKL